MSNQQGSYIAISFFTIHNIITRGLKVSLKSVQGVLQQGIPGENREGLYNFIRALSSVLNSHHLTEDEIAFPYFREKLPDAPFDILISWHQEMVKMLDEIKLRVEKCARDDEIETNLKALEKELIRLNTSWQPHIQLETTDFIIKADRLIPVEEQLRLVRVFAEHGQKLAVPPYLTVPFLLFNLPAEQRKVFSEGMPAEVVENLVPVVWKEQWESMKPYLLA